MQLWAIADFFSCVYGSYVTFPCYVFWGWIDWHLIKLILCNCHVTVWEIGVVSGIQLHNSECHHWKQAFNGEWVWRSAAKLTYIFSAVFMLSWLPWLTGLLLSPLVMLVMDATCKWTRSFISIISYFTQLLHCSENYPSSLNYKYVTLHTLKNCSEIIKIMLPLLDFTYGLILIFRHAR